jgi:thiol-disulfide isomerase/thioredoxin
MASDSIFGKGPVLVLVYNDGCMYCNKLRPDWDRAAANVVPSMNVDVVEIDSTAVSQLMPGSNQMVDAIRSKYSGSVPYIGMLRADKSVETYNGDRSPADIVKFVRNNASS